MTRAIRLRTLALVTALAASLALAVPAVDRAPTAPPDLQVVVRTAGSLGDAVQAISRTGGTVLETFDRFGMVLARVPGAAVPTLASRSDVVSVTPDSGFAPLTRRNSTELGEPSRAAAATIGADTLAAEGITGSGVGIAVVDTGLSPRPGLSDNVMVTVDASGEGNRIDGYGHGTFMSGAIVGDEAGVPGIAPDAHLVGIKVADRTGSTSLSALLRGLSAAVDARDAFGVRVVMLAFGTEVEGENDPLQYAVEQLWSEGLVVVVAAGNGGPGAGTLTTPGASPYVMTVGAVDDRGTADRSDDELPEWSARGPAPRRGGPDLLAPGTSLVSTRVPGSLIDRENPQAQVDGRTFRGSGTSIATAIAAGAAALVIDAHPTLSPDEVKGRLLASAGELATGGDPSATGQGVLDVARAVREAAAPANADLPALVTDERIAGDVNYPYWQGHKWGSHRWAAEDWDDQVWDGHKWGGHKWGSAEWEGHKWGGHKWGGHKWGGHKWGGHKWGSAEWEGHKWGGHKWGGHKWGGHKWGSSTWTGIHWM